MKEFLDKHVGKSLEYVPGSSRGLSGSVGKLVLQHPGLSGSAPGRALIGSAIEWHARGSQPIALALVTGRSKLQHFLDFRPPKPGTERS